MRYDPGSPEVQRDPVPHYDRLRRECPVHHYPVPDADVEKLNDNLLVARPTKEYWSVFRHADVVSVVQQPQAFSSKQGPGPERLVSMHPDGMLNFADGAPHRRQRGIANSAFRPKAVREMTEDIEVTTAALARELGRRGNAEIVSEFSVPLAITTVSRILGIDRDRFDDFHRWARDITASFGGNPESMDRSAVAMKELFEYFTDVISRRRMALAGGGEVPEDMLTHLITAEYNGTHFTDEELLLAAINLVTGGFGTTAAAITNAVHVLCDHPEERAEFEADPTLVDTVVEEVLRYAGPVDGMFRTANTDTAIAGCPVPADAKVRVVFASANRDPEVFTEPDRFKVDRPRSELRHHLGFGTGVHNCIGSALARAELRCALLTLFFHFPGLRLDPERPPVRQEVLTINGFETLHVVWDAERYTRRHRSQG